MTVLVFGHHPFPSSTATTQLDGIRSDLTTNFLAISSFCFWFFWAISYRSLAYFQARIRRALGTRSEAACSAARWLSLIQCKLPTMRTAVSCSPTGWAAPTGRNPTSRGLLACFLVVQEPDAAAAAWMDRETRVVRQISYIHSRQ